MGAKDVGLPRLTGSDAGEAKSTRLTQIDAIDP